MIRVFNLHAAVSCCSSAAVRTAEKTALRSKSDQPSPEGSPVGSRPVSRPGSRAGWSYLMETQHVNTSQVNRLDSWSVTVTTDTKELKPAVTVKRVQLQSESPG